MKIVLVIGLIVMFASITLIMSGIHNVDNSVNMMKLNLNDIGIDNVLRSYDQAYLFGMKQIVYGLYLLFAGFGLTWLDNIKA